MAVCPKCGSVLPTADAPAALNTSANGESFAPANAEFNPDIFRVLAIVSAVLMGISVFFPFMSLDLKIYKLPIRICDQSSFAALLFSSIATIIFGLLMPSDGFSFSNQDYGRMINEKWQNLKK